MTDTARFDFIVKMRRKDWPPNRTTFRVVKADDHSEAERKATSLIGGTAADLYEILSCLTLT